MIGSTESNEILVVDDNDSGLYNKSRILRRAGYAVLEAGTGEDALRLVRDRKPRVVLLDIRLPDIDGREVCRRIKGSSDTASVLVLQMSATFVTDADTVVSLEGGADACLTEPFEAPVLVATVNALLRARKAEMALREALDREQAARTAAESANRAKDEFLATLSHELRSPIGAVLTWVNLLRSGRLDDGRTERALEAIERNTRVQVKMIEDLLDVSRIISRKMRLEVTRVDVATVVQAALDGVREAAEAKNIGLSSFVEPQLGPVTADAARLQQVAWNLLSNAIKFTPEGGQVAIRVDATGNEAVIRVTDTGRGIETAFLPHVFERFRQADASSTRAEGGLGLGLAIVRHLVELHGGTVEAHSDGAGKGAAFTVRLPRAASTAAAAQTTGPATRVAAKAHGQQISGVEVLVVDDEADTREATVLLLQQEGADVTEAHSAEQAVAAFARHAPEVVISDIAMPGEDGYSLILRLRAAGHGARALALTAYAGSEDRKRILAAGYDAYLTKPIDGAELMAAVAGLAAPRDDKEKAG